MALERSVDALNVGDLVAMARRRFWMILTAVVLSAGAGLAVAYLQTPVYEATTIIELAPSVPFTSEMQGLVRLQGGTDRLSTTERMEYAAALKNNMTSRSIIRYLMSQIDLTNLIEQRGAAKIIEQQTAGDTVDRQEVVLQITQLSIASALRVRWAGRDQLEVTYASDNRVQARDLLNLLADRFIEERAARDLEMARSSMDFADAQLKRYDEALKNLEEEQSDLNKKLLSLRSEASASSDAGTADIAQTIANSRKRIATLEDQESGLLKRLRSEYRFQDIQSADLTADALARHLSSDTLTRLQNQLISVAVNMSDIAKRYEWSEGRLLYLRVQENDLLDRITQEGRRIVGQRYAHYEKPDREVLVSFLRTHAELSYLNSKLDYLESALKGIDAKYKQITEYETQLKQIERSIAATSDLRDRFRRQQESSMLTQDVIANVTIGRSRIVEPAKLPLAPVAPNKMKIVVLALLLGLAVGVAAVVTAQVLDQSFYSVDEVARDLDLEVLAVVPAMPRVRSLSRSHPKP